MKPFKTKRIYLDHNTSELKLVYFEGGTMGPLQIRRLVEERYLDQYYTFKSEISRIPKSYELLDYYIDEVSK